MTLLGIDYGTTQIGLALSDESGTVAEPYTTITNDDVVRVLNDIIGNEGITEVVVGMPQPFVGQKKTMMEEVQAFVDDLRSALEVPVVTLNEALTSARARQKMEEARHSRGVSEHAVAAAEILQNLLDARKKEGATE